MGTVIELSVLVVSDEPGATRVLVAILRALDVMRITVVGAGELPEYDSYDLVLIAPAGDPAEALETADRIRRRPDTPGAYIAVLALGVTDDLERFLQWGRIDAVMLKPVTIAGLTTQIEGAIERRMRG